MKIGFLVNDVATEQAGYTTTRLGCEAVNQGHEVYVFGVGDLAYDADESVRARARTVPKKSYGSHETYFKELQGPKAVASRITVDDLDVLMLRNVPSDDVIKRPWAATAATEFGRVAMRHGVIVVNDPNGLAKAASKIYLQLFPAEVRPRAIITRSTGDIRVRSLEETHSAMNSSLHIGADSPLPDISAFVYSVMRLPQCMPRVELVLMGQSRDNLR